VIYSLKVNQPKQQKLKKILQRYVIYISDQITVPYLNIETGNRRLNIDGQSLTSLLIYKTLFLVGFEYFYDVYLFEINSLAIRRTVTYNEERC
jgi:hypothetical protein